MLHPGCCLYTSDVWPVHCQSESELSGNDRVVPQSSNANESWVILKRGCPLTSFSCSLSRPLEWPVPWCYTSKSSLSSFIKAFFNIKWKDSSELQHSHKNLKLLILYLLPCAGWTQHEIFYKALLFTHIWSVLEHCADTFCRILHHGSCQCWSETVKQWKHLNDGPLLCLFSCAAAARYDPHSRNPPKNVNVKSAMFHYPFF